MGRGLNYIGLGIGSLYRLDENVKSLGLTISYLHFSDLPDGARKPNKKQIEYASSDPGCRIGDAVRKWSDPGTRVCKT